MKKLLMSILIGMCLIGLVAMSLVGCGSKREVNNVMHSEYDNLDYLVMSNPISSEFVMGLIAEDLENVKDIDFTKPYFILKDGHYIVYGILEYNPHTNNFEVFVYDVVKGEEKELKEYMKQQKPIWEEACKKNLGMDEE
ncbi:hypothetical protein LQE93_16480 [Clostridium sp. NSJ-145]|uniref:hypothetical protein n=1 Tax=Clostridium sp. NSJ-145 TaxID=2897777 RepID=UPI001E4AB719|nr:hypothetical protein [Clostridium sp. NSJ-145]MCD2503327.1 hypothetical protein [Clostridium sp. NSJ-145]